MQVWKSAVEAWGVRSSCHGPVMWLLRGRGQAALKLKCPSEKGTICGKISSSQPVFSDLSQTSDRFQVKPRNCLSSKGLWSTLIGLQQRPWNDSELIRHFSPPQWPNKTNATASCQKSRSLGAHRKWLTGDTACLSLSLWFTNATFVKCVFA